MSPPGVNDEHLADHRGNVLVEGAGHWVQQEKPDEVNARAPRLPRRHSTAEVIADARCAPCVKARSCVRDVPEPEPGFGQVLVQVQGLRHLRLRPALREARRRRCSPSASRCGACPSWARSLRDRPVARRVHGPRVLGRGARGRQGHGVARAGHARHVDPLLLSMTGIDPIVYSNTTLGGYAERMLLSAPLLLEVPNGLDSAPRRAHRADGRRPPRREQVRHRAGRGRARARLRPRRASR